MLDALNGGFNLSMTVSRDGLTVTANGVFGIVAAVVVIAVVLRYAVLVRRGPPCAVCLMA